MQENVWLVQGQQNGGRRWQGGEGPRICISEQEATDVPGEQVAQFTFPKDHSDCYVEKGNENNMGQQSLSLDFRIQKLF